MRNVTGAFEYPISGRDRIAARSLVDACAILLITAGYEMYAISRSFINRLYNCAGKCIPAVKYHERRAMDGHR
jgi:hypothetical protein